MVHVHSRKFCCCLPVRLAVFLLAGFGAVVGSIAAAATWYIVVRAKQNGLTENGSLGIDWSSFNDTNIQNENDLKDALDKVSVSKQQWIALIVSGVVLTLWGLFSWFGFIGSIIKKRGFVAIFSSWLWFLVGLQLSAFILNLIQMIRARNDKPSVDQCVQQVKNNGGSAIHISDDDINNACKTVEKWLSNAALAVYIVGFVIGWVITIYLAIIIKRYVEQLDEEQAFKHTRSGNVIHAAEAGSNTSYYPHQPLLNHHEMAPTGNYPYAHGQNAFGGNGKH